MLDWKRFTYLTFDCYGTLIDWETGILAALGEVCDRHRVQVSAERLLELYATFEARREAGAYRPYREVLRGVVDDLGGELGFQPEPEDRDALPESIGRWPPFPDTVAALRRLGQRYLLGILSNVDDDLFAASAPQLEVAFDEVVTAQQLRSYKPAQVNFRRTLERLGLPAGRVLHVAQSLYHDHVPARAVGLSTVWVNRPSRRPGAGVAPPARVTPDLEVPDLTTLADLALA